MKRKNKTTSEENIRSGFIQHTAAYLIVNAVLWAIWLLTTRGFPWPLFVTAFWGIGMVRHFVDYYYKHWKGAQKREAEIQAQINNLQRLETLQQSENNYLYEDERREAALVYELDKVKPEVRLMDDGELADAQIMDARST